MLLYYLNFIVEKYRTVLQRLQISVFYHYWDCLYIVSMHTDWQGCSVTTRNDKNKDHRKAKNY